MRLWSWRRFQFDMRLRSWRRFRFDLHSGELFAGSRHWRSITRGVRRRRRFQFDPKLGGISSGSKRWRSIKRRLCLSCVFLSIAVDGFTRGWCITALTWGCPSKVSAMSNGGNKTAYCDLAGSRSGGRLTSDWVWPQKERCMIDASQLKLGRIDVGGIE
jgi:hypothetical protein